ncbi:hypothetical protein Cadr_000023976 [Camelus dromedarius]|uniref:Uncharacterized protein n=1 Tax=Camelus dromedarius TaxID=9838 RepID=A0A5N4CWJ4_CAMDR|nr:hypothetical protein Cadr_000023976 [Camelus dromedarius]
MHGYMDGFVITEMLSWTIPHHSLDKNPDLQFGVGPGPCGSAVDSTTFHAALGAREAWMIFEQLTPQCFAQQRCSPGSLHDQRANPSSPLQTLGLTYSVTPASLGDKMEKTPGSG